mmetsp:Transcript_42212/g.105417  ORF Transcript_42212/g.105417 Transcript_42212/m.105417 type:complete len:209 (+) Transcript_42212:770-1396(+)
MVWHGSFAPIESSHHQSRPPLNHTPTPPNEGGSLRQRGTHRAQKKPPKPPTPSIPIRCVIVSCICTLMRPNSGSTASCAWLSRTAPSMSSEVRLNFSSTLAPTSAWAAIVTVLMSYDDLLPNFWNCSTIDLSSWSINWWTLMMTSFCRLCAFWLIGPLVPAGPPAPIIWAIDSRTAGSFWYLSRSWSKSVMLRPYLSRGSDGCTFLTR